MSTTSGKLDDGHAAKCFPVRTLQHRGRDGDGHWLVAYRKSEELRYSHRHRHMKDSEVDEAPHGQTLDGPLLLRLHCVDKPSELCRVNISEQELDSVKPEDLRLFDNVAYIDASVNFLSLGFFSSFASLRELDLSLNGIQRLRFTACDFPQLQVLDLSYNNLLAEDFVSIGRLPRLKVLHLTGNQLHHLPPLNDPAHLSYFHQMGAHIRSITFRSPKASKVMERSADEDELFKCLEVLMLDDNKLTSGVFNSLRNMQRLKHLNLQRNCVSEIPNVSALNSDEAKPAHAEPLPRHHGPLITSSQEKLRQGERPPLPQLQVLNLSDNKVAEEESLMAAALFPMLRELDIHSNPLTTQRSGDPPLLTHDLQERLGVKIKRKKTQVEVDNTTQRTTKHTKSKKVEDGIFTLSKKPLVMDVVVETTPGCEEMKDRGDAQHFFVTQAADISGHDMDGKVRDGKKDDDHERFLLMDPSPNSQPIGIQTAVRMLEHTLRTLSVYTDSKAEPDSIQMPHRERGRRINDLPPLRPAKASAERVDHMLREIGQSTTVTGVDLSEVIHGTGVDKQEHQEVLRLLSDMKTKYKILQKRSLDQSAAAQTERNSDSPPAL